MVCVQSWIRPPVQPSSPLALFVVTFDSSVCRSKHPFLGGVRREHHPSLCCRNPETPRNGECASVQVHPVCSIGLDTAMSSSTTENEDYGPVEEVLPAMDPLALLQDDLADGDPEIVKAAISRLDIVAAALGPAKTRNELIPFLEEYVQTDNDESLTIIAKHFRDFVPFIGGKEYIPILLPMLETLCGEEEVVVRDEAAESICHLCPSLGAAGVEEHVIPLLHRLAKGEWFTTRVSCARLFRAVYPILAPIRPELGAELRAIFAQLAGDGTPMVVRAAYRAMPDFVRVLEAEVVREDIPPLVRDIVTHDVDNMRLLGIPVLRVLAELFTPEEHREIITPFVEALTDDASWRVRKETALQIVDLFSPLVPQPEVCAQLMLPFFTRLLNDSDPEVRSAAAKQLGAVAKVCPAQSTGTAVIPYLQNLAQDWNETVRIGLASSLGTLAVAMGKETSLNVILPLLKILMKDEMKEVRQHIVEDCQLFADAIGVDEAAHSLFPFILELSRDSKWRVRSGVLEKMDLFASVLGVTNFEQQLLNILTTGLTDHVAEVRRISVEQISKAVRLFGLAWANQTLLPTSFQIYSPTGHYLQRLTCLRVVEAVAPLCPPLPGSSGAEEKQEDTALLDAPESTVQDTLMSILMPIVRAAVGDDIPNVRIGAARCLGILSRRFPKQDVQDILIPKLRELMSDPDDDVAYTAQINYSAVTGEEIPESASAKNV